MADQSDFGSVGGMGANAVNGISVKPLAIKTFVTTLGPNKYSQTSSVAGARGRRKKYN